MWQKARFIEVHSTPLKPGHELWVIGPVHLAAGVDPVTEDTVLSRRALYCNHLTRSFERCSVAIDDIELLGGPDAFCEDPPLISFLEWVGVDRE